MTGLLVVFAETGPDVSEANFTDWYDNEHAPPRLSVPGFINAVRYKATDSKTPSWLAIYDLDDPSVATSEPYKALAARASDRERDIITHLTTLDRRIYETYSVQVNPGNPHNIFPGKYISLAEMHVQPELDEDFNRWYEEHISHMSKVPGWTRTRRYKLFSPLESKGTTAPAPDYFAIHEWTNDTYRDTPEFTAMATPKTLKMLKEVTSFSARRFEIHKEIQKPE